MTKEKKVAFVTGGSRGIGKAIALRLADTGFRVYISYNKNAELADAVVAQIKQNRGEAKAVQMEVCNRESVKSAFSDCMETFGAFDVLVNNAGINKPTDFDEISDNDWDDILNVNLKGPFICAQEVLPHMEQSHSGSIINIGSVSGQYGGPRTAHYAASKAGLISLSQVIARFAASKNIRCNTVAAGLIASEMAEDGLKSAVVAKAAEAIVLNRFGRVDEVADVVAFLASDQSSYITAQTINVNGGLYF